ncbi:hypothetical protein [uncultured Ruminococcus sp.]|uniref:DUF7832 domain-containing protein n=1 Tax=uncultured Ruminococcus sp. TaxID=165186 RepID=UPI0025D2B956|nr:hypothetical protein [uncultured Ruminococcus sp.]
MRFLNILQKIMYSILATFEIMACVAVIGATVDPAKGNDPLSPLSMVAAALLMFMLLIAVSFGGMARLFLGKKLVFASNMLMRLFIVGTGMMAMVVTMGANGEPLIYGLIFLADAMIGLGAYFLGKHADKISYNSIKYNGSAAYKIENFECDKAKWAWDAAVKEYYRGDIPEVIPDNERDEIQEYCALPIACYLLWLLRRGGVSDVFLDMIPKDVLERVKNGSESPVSLLACTDYVFSCDMVAEEYQAFTNNYYWDAVHRGERHFPHSCFAISYQFDYFEFFGGGQRYYINEWSQTSQKELEFWIERRFAEYDSDLDDSKGCGSYNSEVYGWEAHFELSKGADDEDLRKCLEDFQHPSDRTRETIRKRLEEYAEDFGVEKENVFDFFHADTVKVYHSLDGQPAYTITGYGSFGDYDDDGFSVTVRGEDVSPVQAAYEGINPYSDWMDHYEAFYAYKEDERRTVMLTPFECGGEQSEENSITLHPSLADFKDSCDTRIECLIKQGCELSYKCDPVLSNDKVRGLMITARDKDGRNEFFDSMTL